VGDISDIKALHIYMIGSCLRWMIRTENPNERDVHLKAGLEYKLSQHCSSPMNTQHPKGSLWQE